MCLAVRFVLMLLWHVFLYVQLLVLEHWCLPVR